VPTPPADLELLAIGETMVMLTPDPPVPLRESRELAVHIGGAESNVAMHMAFLGHRVAWASRLGAGALGDRIRDEIESAGVDCSGVTVAPAERTGVYFKDPGDGATVVHYYRAGSAASAMNSEFVAGLVDRLPEVVHVSGITPALSESCAQAIEEIVVDRAFGSSLVSFDVNHRPGLWTVGEAGLSLLRFARHADIVFVGLDEARSLWGSETAEDVRRLIPDAPHLIVKDGAVEAVEFEGDAVTRLAARTVDVVESVGAGDAFAAGWLSARARGVGPRQRLAVGHLLAARVLGVVGDQAGAPDSVELLAALGDQSEGSEQ
jgi:2-dehydro-3-deoxygluconokinase